MFDICLIAIRSLLGSGLPSPTCTRCFCSKMMLVHVPYDSGRNGSYSVLLKSAQENINTTETAISRQFVREKTTTFARVDDVWRATTQMTSLFHAPGHFRFPLAVQNTGNIFLDYLGIRPHCAQSGNGEECRHLERPNTLPAYMVSRPVLLVSTTPSTNYQYHLASSFCGLATILANVCNAHLFMLLIIIILF